MKNEEDDANASATDNDNAAYVLNGKLNQADGDVISFTIRSLGKR